MRVLVCGGRKYNDVCRVCWKLDELHRKSPIGLVIHGKARGADTLADAWAKSLGIPVAAHEANWDDVSRPGAVVKRRRDGTSYDAAAGGVRNQLMLDQEKPDLVVAFPGGAGTEDMVRRAYRARVPVMEIKDTMGPTMGPQDAQIDEIG